MTITLDEVRAKIDGALVHDAERGVYRNRRDAFTDPEIFELEMKYIFEGNWIYLAHESQLPNNNDYLTVYMGRQPVVISRDKNGELHALINACSHKGAMLCRRKKDNRSTFTCPFHGWTFRNNGQLLKVKDPRGAGYPEQFKTEGSHDLTRVPRFESYRGFLFGSLNPDVPPLTEHLGGSAKIIDMVVDQSPEGLEVLKGSSTYTYDGNWKVQAENGADGYHVSAVHWNYAATTARRGTGESATETKAMDAGQWGKLRGGYYAWEKGHVLLWNEWGNPEDRPLWSQRTEFAEKYGQAYADWMLQVLPQPVCLPERLHHGSVRLADPPFPAGRGGPDRGHDLLHRAEGGERRGAYRADPPVRGLLQRLRYGHPGRSGGVPVLPEDLPGHGGAVERSEPGRHALDRGRGRGGQDTRARAGLQRGQDRGRGSFRRSARLLAERHAAGRGRRSRSGRERGGVTIMAVTVGEVEQFLYREARYLDDREFDKWLACYAPDSEFWMPAWDDDDTLVTDPQTEISLIYYNNRGGLEDRVFRIKTDRSSATSLPEPRTSHNISNVEIVGQSGDTVEVRFNWFTLYYRYQNIDPYFGTSFYTLDFSGTSPLIKKKKVVLKNDYIHHVVDIYHV